MSKALPIVELHPDTMPDWRRVYEPVNGIHVIVDNKTNKPILAIHADDTATLVMAIPKLLKFLSLFGFNHSCRLPIDNMLSSANVKLIRKGETNVKSKSETMAE